MRKYLYDVDYIESRKYSTQKFQTQVDNSCTTLSSSLLSCFDDDQVRYYAGRLLFSIPNM